MAPSRPRGRDRPTPPPPHSRRALAALFAVTGTLHFVIPGVFAAMVPDWLPAPLTLVYVSGACELAGAAGVLALPTRRAAAWGLIALLVAVFPANIEMLRAAHAGGAPAWQQAALWLRLSLQPLLAWWTWAAAGRPVPRAS